MSYDSIGDEQPGDLIAVCALCHRTLHGLPDPVLVAANDNQLELPLFRKLKAS